MPGCRSNVEYLNQVERSRAKRLREAERRKNLDKYAKNQPNGLLSQQTIKQIEENHKHKNMKGVMWSKADRKKQKAIENTMPLCKWGAKA